MGQEFVVKDMMKAFNKSFDDIKKMLDTFAEATHQNSAMTYSEFCKYLDLEEEVSIQAKERASRNRRTVVDISIPLPSFQPVSLSLSRSPLF